MKENLKIKIKNVSLTKNNHTILSDINLEIKNKSKSVITGKSGSGKTSLLRLINRLEEPSSGSIYYNGTDIKQYDTLNLRTHVSLVLQIPIVLGDTVREDLLIQSNLDISPSPSTEKLVETLELCGLSEQFLNKKSDNLSIGEKQRLCIARSIINKPDLILLDEPSSSLDKDNSYSILQMINNLNKELGITIIMVTHKIDETTHLNADYYTLSDGHISRGLKTHANG